MTRHELYDRITDLTARSKNALIRAHKANSHAAAVKFMNEHMRLQAMVTKLARTQTED